LSFDSNWVESSNKKAALKLEKLDADLKSAKSLSIKDCIRRGQEDLADHFLDMGDLTNALKCYSRSRDYCSTNKNIVNLCLNVIKVNFKIIFIGQLKTLFPEDPLFSTGGLWVG